MWCIYFDGANETVSAQRNEKEILCLNNCDKINVSKTIAGCLIMAMAHTQKCA